MKPEIRVRDGEVQGYGGPGYYWVAVTYQNTLLEYKKVSTEEELGEFKYRFRKKWDKNWKDVEFAAAIKNKKSASVSCSHCGGDTIDGSLSCVEKVFCKKCEPEIEKYQTAYADARVKQQAIWDAERDEKERVRQAERLNIISDAQTGFHWRDGWFFKRQPTSNIRVSLVQNNELRQQVEIPPNEWASIVCSVSGQGETCNRWNHIQDFHGRT